MKSSKKTFSVRKDSYFCPKYECLIKHWIQLHETFKFSIYSRQHNWSHQFKLDLLTKCIFAAALVRMSLTDDPHYKIRNLIVQKKVFLFQFLSNLDIPYHFCFSRCLRRCLRGGHPCLFVLISLLEKWITIYLVAYGSRGASLFRFTQISLLEKGITIYSEISNH